MATSALAAIQQAKNKNQQSVVSNSADSVSNVDSSKNNGGFFGGLGYLGEKLGLGALALTEGIWDFTAGHLADWFGADDWADSQFANDWVNYNHADEWYDPGEGWKTVGDVINTVPYAVEKVHYGATQSLEGIHDYVVGGVASLVGADDFAKRMFDDDLGDYTYADRKYGVTDGWRKTVGDVAGGIGTSVPSIAANFIPVVGPAVGIAVAGLGAAGNATKEAYRETGELGGKEYGYGAMVGGTEAVIEGVSGKLGAGAKGIKDIITDGASKSIFKSAAKETAETISKKAIVSGVFKEMGKQALSEGVEEAIAEIATPYWKRLTYDPGAANATPQEVWYAAFVGGMSGAIMSGGSSGISIATNYSSGNKAINDGKAETVLEKSRYFAEREAVNDTGLEVYKNIKEKYEALQKSLDETNGEYLRMEQKVALGELNHMNAVATTAPFVEYYAQKVVFDAAAQAERLNAIGIKDADGNVINITAEMLTEGVDLSLARSKNKADHKKFSKQLRKALSSNSVLTTVATMEATGRLMMDAKTFAQAAEQGKTWISEYDFHRFVETAPAEAKAEVAAKFGIDDIDSVSYERFMDGMTDYLLSPDFGNDVRRTRRSRMAQRVSPAEAQVLPETLPEGMTDGAYRFKVDESNHVGVIKEGDRYRLYNYQISRESGETYTKAEAEKLLGQMKADAAQVAAKMQQNVAQSENDATKNNISGNNSADVNNKGVQRELTRINSEKMQVGDNSPNVVLQKDGESGIINTDGKETQNEQRLHLREGNERNRGQDPHGQVSAVESGAEQAKGRTDLKEQRNSKAASRAYGRKVSAKELGIEGGLKSSKVRLVAESNENASMKKARELAESRGLKVTFFTEANLHIVIDGKIASVRGYVNGDEVFVRADHPHYTADQIMRHEVGHDMISRGEVDVNEVRERIENRFGKENVQFIADRYADAYAGSDMTAGEIWEEIICDSLGDMNVFASKGVLGEINNDFLWRLKGEVNSSKKDARGPPSAKEKFSISPNLDSDLDSVLNGTFNAHNNEVYLGETSNFMTDTIGAEAISLYMPASKVYSSLVTEEEYNKKPYYSKQDHYHGIDKADFIEILEMSESPILAFAAAPDEDGNERYNRIVLVTDKKVLDLESGKYEYAVVVEEVNATGWHSGKRVKANKTITVYPRSQLESDVISAIINNRILHQTKKGEHLFAGVQGSNPQGAIQKDVLKKNIAYFWANVKWEKQKNKTFSTKEAEVPSAFRLALEKAGYFDQDGHSKYMQEGTDVSHKKDKNSGKTSRELDVNSADYNNFGWVRANNIINAGYWRNFTENFAQAVADNSYYRKNKQGEYMIDVYDVYGSSEVADVVVFASGTIESPNVTKIVKINLTDDTDIETKRSELYAAERKGIRRSFGEVFIFYNKSDFLGERRNQGDSIKGVGNNDRLDTKRRASEAKANPIIEFYVNEDKGTITTTYANGETVTESFNKGKSKGKASRELDWDTLEEIFAEADDTSSEMFDADAVIVKGPPTENMSAPKGIKQVVANFSNERVYGKGVMMSVIDKLPDMRRMTAKARGEFATVLHEAYKQLDTAEQKRTFAHDMAEYMVAREMREIMVDNPQIDTELLEGRMARMRTGIGSLTFSKSDIAEIRYNRDLSGLRSILGRWNRKKQLGYTYTVDQFVTDFARETPGMEYLEDMHPVDALLEIDDMYTKTKAELGDKLVSMYEVTPDEEIRGMVGYMEHALLSSFENEGEGLRYFADHFADKMAYWQLSYKELVGRNELVNMIDYQMQEIRDLKEKTYLNASEYADGIFDKSIGVLASIKYKGNINPKLVRGAAKDLLLWYNKENPLLEYASEDKSGYYVEDIREALERLANGKDKLSKADLKDLYNTLTHFKNIMSQYNKVFMNGKYVEAAPLAKGFVNTADVNSAVGVGALNNLKLWYENNFGDPLSVVKWVDQYQENGFYTEMFHMLQRAGLDAQIAEMRALEAYDKFMNAKENKGYERRLTEVVDYNGKKMTRAQLMSLYMTSKREQAWAGLIINGFTYQDANGKSVRVFGRAHGQNAKEIDLTQQVADMQKEIEALFSNKDKEYIKIVEAGFETAKQLKIDRDMQRYGYTNALEGYYYPIMRANTAKNIDTSMKGDIDRVSSASFNKDTVKGAKQELRISGVDTVFLRHIHAVTQYAYLSPSIETFNKLFNLDISGNKNKAVTVKTQTKDAWNHQGKNNTSGRHIGEEYFRKLIEDIQGIHTYDEAGKFIAKMRGNYATYALGANPKVWATQFSSAFASTSILDYDCLLRSFKDAKDVDIYCELAKLRNKDNAAAKAQGVVNKLGAVSDFLMKPIGVVDRFVISRLFIACQVQVQKNGGAKMGTEANKVKAGELLERVILETQQNSLATERSSAMRSSSEFMKSITMFSADAMKVVGRVIDGFGEVNTLDRRIKLLQKVQKDGATYLDETVLGKTSTTGDKTDSSRRTIVQEIEALKKQKKAAGKKLGRSVGALTTSALFMAIVAKAFRALYHKDRDKDDEEKARDFVIDFIGNFFGGLPIIKEIWGRVAEGYELDSPTYSMINDVLNSATGVFELVGKVARREATSQDIARGVRNLAYSAGQMTGMPVRNMYNIAYGIVGIDEAAAYKMDNVFYKKNYRNDLYKYIEDDNAQMIEFTMNLVLSESVGDGVSDTVKDELVGLLKDGRSVLPRNISSVITYQGEEYQLTDGQLSAVRSAYADQLGGLEVLFSKANYKSLSGEDKERAVKYAYDLYYESALSSALGIEKGNSALVSDVVGAENMALLSVATRGLESDKDQDGKSVSGSKRKKVISAINSLGLSREKKLLLICAKGYSIQDGDIRGLSAANAKRVLLRYILSLKISKDEKARLAVMCGFEVTKNGRIVAKSAFSA